MKEFYTMSNKEIKRLEVLQKLIQRELTQIQASELLGVSARQVRRILKRYCNHGVSGVISERRGKPSNNKIAEPIKQYAISLVNDYYKDFGPTLAAEKLLEKHEIKLSVETVRSLMINANIWPSLHVPPYGYPGLQIRLIGCRKNISGLV